MTAGYAADPHAQRDAVARWHLPVTTAQERAAAKRDREAPPVPTFGCSSCGRFAFPVPTVCFSCRPRSHDVPTVGHQVASAILEEVPNPSTLAAVARVSRKKPPAPSANAELEL